MSRWPMRIVGILLIVMLFMVMYGMIKTLQTMQATRQQQSAPAR